MLYASPLQDGVDNVWTDPFTFYRKVLGDTVDGPDRTARSTRSGPARRSCPTASSTRVTRRCRPPGSTSRSPRTAACPATSPASARSAPSTSSGSTAATTLGTASDHNIYAPFNQQWIPATAAGPAASGVDGEAANNFNGFLVNGLYTNWDVAATLVTALGGNTNCLLRREPRLNIVDLTSWDKQFRQLPSGAQNIVVYTDEHGEAQVSYTPGTGMYFDNVGAIMNDNGGCDLQGIDVIGTSNITATARYPYQPVTDPAKTSVAAHEDRALAVRQEPDLLAQGPRRPRTTWPGSSSPTRRTSPAPASTTSGSASWRTP